MNDTKLILADMKVIDQKSFLDTFQYFDKEIVVEIIDIFINEYPERMAALKKDIELLDFNAIKFDAHSMKGVIANFVAPIPQQLAKELEMKGSENDASDLKRIYAELEIYGAELVEDLKELRPEFI
jgi:HPt (histidine-containing phosphotransfer) domain-containing protein